MIYFYIENRITKNHVNSEFLAPLIFMSFKDAKNWINKNRDDQTRYSIKKVSLVFD